MGMIDALPLIAPLAISWAEDHSSQIAQYGGPLDPRLMEMARSVGVQHPERIRISEVPSLPQPEHPVLAEAASRTGMLGPGMVGLTLFYGIYVVAGHCTDRLLAHEFRHVAQYESFGSLSSFLSEYLRQILTVGYHDAPLEIDARRFEAM